MPREKIIMDSQTMQRTLARLSHEILEKNVGQDTLYLVGIKKLGVPLARMIKENIERFSDIKVELGELDITLYRDDLTQKYPQPIISKTVIDFDVNGKVIIMVDDVLYTGRTARAAVDALMGLGRPAAIQFCVLVDRGHRELPICANYIGKNLPTSKDEFVKVSIDNERGDMNVAIASKD